MWFRLYTDVRDDPKVQRLPDAMFKHWVNLLCLAKEGGGLLPSIEDIAYKLKLSESDAKCLVEALVERQLLDSDGKTLSPHNWHNRQFESDSSTERVKRFRSVSETLPETEADTETEPEQIQSRAEAASRGKPRSVRAPVLPDDEFLDGLQKNPAYSMLNVRHCYQRMIVWCEANGRQPSRRRFINWLNREDKPMTARASPPKNPAAHVGKSIPDTPADGNGMAEYIEQLIELDDWIHLGQEYDAIVKRGGAKAEWEIHLVAYFELHKDDPVPPGRVAELKRQINAIANNIRRADGD